MVSTDVARTDIAERVEWPQWTISDWITEFSEIAKAAANHIYRLRANALQGMEIQGLTYWK